jgi:hypothetical protein
MVFRYRFRTAML